MKTAEFRSEAVDNSTYVIAVTGEVDLANAAELQREIAQASQKGAEALVVDLSEVTHLDSTGLGMLFNARKPAGTGTRLALVVAPGPLQRLFEVRGIEGLFDICGTREEALETVREGA
jgi:anti-anti-sigma factor